MKDNQIGRQVYARGHRMRVLFVAVAGVCLGMGCARYDVHVARGRTNARLVDDSCFGEAYSGEIVEDIRGEIILDATMKESSVVAKRRRGNWIRSWHRLAFDDIEVHRGRWDTDELTFLLKDGWPTPESGIMLKKMPWPFQFGRRTRFHINRTRRSNVIVKFSERGHDGASPGNSRKDDVVPRDEAFIEQPKDAALRSK